MFRADTGIECEKEFSACSLGFAFYHAVIGTVELPDFLRIVRTQVLQRIQYPRDADRSRGSSTSETSNPAASRIFFMAFFAFSRVSCSIVIYFPCIIEQFFSL